MQTVVDALYYKQREKYKDQYEQFHSK
jgi:hypothetical protein